MWISAVNSRITYRVSQYYLYLFWKLCITIHGPIREFKWKNQSLVSLPETSAVTLEVGGWGSIFCTDFVQITLVPHPPSSNFNNIRGKYIYSVRITFYMSNDSHVCEL